MTQSLYEKYGGFGSINKIVMDFYDVLLDDDELGPYFDEIDMRRLIDHQTKFIASLLGGPASFTDDHLARAHAGLSISEAHYSRLMLVLGETLTSHGFSPDDVAEVMALVEEKRARIVV